MSESTPVRTLTIPDFDPEGIVLADVFPYGDPPDGQGSEAPATVEVGLNSADLRYVYIAIDPPGSAVLARETWPDLRLTQGVWMDLRPAEAMELAARIRTCAEAAIRFAEADPEVNL